jgi:hypothetical protein
MRIRTTPSPSPTSTPTPNLQTCSSHCSIVLALHRGGQNSAILPSRTPYCSPALINAIADTSSTTDVVLITELVRHGADVNYDDGKAFKLAVSQADSPILYLLCGAHPTIKARSIALPCVFDTNSSRRATTYAMLELLLANSIEEGPATQTLTSAIRGGFNLDIVEQLTAADA